MKHVKLLLVLDESGSMVNVESDTIGGVNSYIENLAKGTDARVDVALMQFATSHRIVRPLAPIRTWKPLTEHDYKASGPSTRLYDAMGDLYTMASLVDDGTPVLVVVVTDGLDNDSKRYDRQQILHQTQQLERRGHWTFVYLGANQDAWAVGQGFGYANTYTWQPTPVGVYAAYRSVTVSSVDFCNSDAPVARNFFTPATVTVRPE